MTFEAVLKRR